MSKFCLNWVFLVKKTPINPMFWSIFFMIFILFDTGTYKNSWNNTYVCRRATKLNHYNSTPIGIRSNHKIRSNLSFYFFLISFREVLSNYHLLRLIKRESVSDWWPKRESLSDWPSPNYHLLRLKRESVSDCSSPWRRQWINLQKT